jgi:hypothetical protein
MKQRIWAALALTGFLTGGLLWAGPRKPKPDDKPDPPPAARRADGDFWASIAYSKSTGVYGYAFNAQTADEASATALSMAKAPDAVTVHTFKKGWAGLVVGPDGDYDIIEGEARTGIAREANQRKADTKAGRKGGELVLLIGHAGFVRQKAPVADGDHFAAIAWSEKNGNFAYASGRDSADDAEKRAVKFVGDTKAMTISSKAWCALAQSPDGYWFAAGDSEDEANDKAMEDAAKHSNTARVVLLVSGDGFAVRYADGSLQQGFGKAR